MKRSSVLILVLLVAVVLWSGACRCGPRDPSKSEADPPPVPKAPAQEEAPADPHGWLEVEIEASYSEEEGLSINMGHHDVGVHGPEDVLTWFLQCEGCPEGTQWRLMDYQLVADLDAMTETVIEIFQGKLKVTDLTNESLGLAARGDTLAAAREAYVLEEPGWDEWAEWSPEQRIKATSMRDPEEGAHDQLWKYAVEIRVPGFDESIPCDEDPYRACWDPHNFRHRV
jgi:uncharacterized protein (DUF3820 family)